MDKGGSFFNEKNGRMLQKGIFEFTHYLSKKIFIGHLLNAQL